MQILKSLLIAIGILLLVSVVFIYGLFVLMFTAKSWVNSSGGNQNSFNDFFTSMAVSNFGEFGDSFGLLTSAFAGLSVFLIFLTWRSQKEELKITREQMQFQQVENSLFQMFAVLNDIVSRIEYSGTSRGVESFLAAYNNFYHISGGGTNRENSTNELECDLTIISGWYDNKFWPHARASFGHYFRYLYRIMRVIDDSILPIEQKIKLAKVVRAQLSDFELALLFYNVQAEVGKKFEGLCYKYDLLDNLPSDIYFCDEHQEIMISLREKYKVKLKNKL